MLQLVGERVALLLHGAQRLGYRQLSRHLAGIEPGFQALDLGIAGGGGLLQLAGQPSRGQLDGIALVLLGQFQPLMQLLLEGLVANLLQDVRIPGLINLECLAAVRADDVVHILASPAFVGNCLSIIARQAPQFFTCYDPFGPAVPCGRQ